jgi:hypothetical protein
MFILVSFEFELNLSLIKNDSRFYVIFLVFTMA